MTATYRLEIFFKGDAEPRLSFDTHAPFPAMSRGDTFDARPQNHGIWIIDDVRHSMLGTASDPIFQITLVVSPRTPEHPLAQP